MYPRTEPFVFCSLFNDAFSVIRLYSVDGRMTSEWWWIDEDKHPCLKRDTNPRSQRPSNQDLRIRPRSYWERLLTLSSPVVTMCTSCLTINHSEFCTFDYRMILTMNSDYLPKQQYRGQACLSVCLSVTEMYCPWGMDWIIKWYYLDDLYLKCLSMYQPMFDAGAKILLSVPPM
jgi:hypothetical protein